MVRESEEIKAFFAVIGGGHRKTIRTVRVPRMRVQVAFQRTQSVQIFFYGIQCNLALLSVLFRKAYGVFLLSAGSNGEFQASVCNSTRMIERDMCVIALLIIPQTDNR